MKNKKIIYLAAALIFTVFMIGYYGVMLLQSTNEKVYTVTVTEKGRTSYNYLFWTVHKYLIYTVDENGTVQVFENTDAPLHGKFNSADYYAKIKVGETYIFKTVGHRLPFMSMFRNIIRIQEIRENEQKE